MWPQTAVVLHLPNGPGRQLVEHRRGQRLGDGLRWADIRDTQPRTDHARRNHHHTSHRHRPSGLAAQPPRRRHTTRDSTQTARRALTPRRSQSNPEITSGPSPKSSSRRHGAVSRPDTEIAPYWAELVTANTDRLLPPGDPNLIYPQANSSWSRPRQRAPTSTSTSTATRSSPRRHRKQSTVDPDTRSRHPPDEPPSADDPPSNHRQPSTVPSLSHTAGVNPRTHGNSSRPTSQTVDRLPTTPGDLVRPLAYVAGTGLLGAHPSGLASPAPPHPGRPTPTWNRHRHSRRRSLGVRTPDPRCRH